MKEKLNEKGSQLIHSLGILSCGLSIQASTEQNII